MGDEAWKWVAINGQCWQVKLSLKCKNDFRADGLRRDALCCTGVILAFLQPCLELLCDCEKLNCWTFWLDFLAWGQPALIRLCARTFLVRQISTSTRSVWKMQRWNLNALTRRVPLKRIHKIFLLEYPLFLWSVKDTKESYFLGGLCESKKLTITNYSWPLNPLGLCLPA